MNTYTFTNSDGTIVTITSAVGHNRVAHLPVLALAVLAVIFIGSGLYLLLRTEKSGS